MTSDGHGRSGQWAYAALGVRPGSPRAEIDLAYRRAARRHHPDTGGDPERFLELTAARALLRPPLDRASSSGQAAPNVVFVANRRPRWWSAIARRLSGSPRPPTRQLS